MLHLQAGVHFEEVEILILADHEFHRAGRLVFHRLGQRHGLLAHGAARGVADEGRWRLFDHLLVAALDGAFALVQVDHVAVAVAQDLDLDMARLLHELLDEDAVVAEGVARLVLASGKALQRLLVVIGHAQALAAAAGRGLDHHRVADVPRDLHRPLGRCDGVVPARNGVDLGFIGQLLGRDLVAHGRDRMRPRADEGDALVFTALGESLVLRQEAVARMDGLSAGLLGRGNDAVGQQIRLPRGRRADVDGLVGQLDVAGLLVGVGIDGDGGDAHLFGGGDDAAGDFAAVGDEDFGEHGLALA